MLRVVLALILIGAIAYCVYQIIGIIEEYQRADEMQKEMLLYKPEPQDTQRPVSDPTHVPKEPVVNQNVIDAQNEVNSDIVGWLSIPGTNVDYLFVQAQDNDFYLHRDLYKQRASAGSIFMDARNSKDFSDFNTILYGHHMRNGSMFQSLRRFEKEDFFDLYLTGTIFLPYQTYTLRIFAYMIIESDDAVINRTLTASPQAKEYFFSYVEENAVRYRSLDFTSEDRVVTLMSCSYEYDDARMVLLARLEE